MTHKNPIDRIKQVATTSLKAPVGIAGSAVGLAQGATGRAAGVVSSLVGGGRKDSEAIRPEQDEPAPTEPTPTDAAPVEVTPDEPVNVTEALGLDPSPVAKPKRPRKKAAAKPTTSIDAAADAVDVDVTPADIAPTAGKDVPQDDDR